MGFFFLRADSITDSCVTQVSHILSEPPFFICKMGSPPCLIVLFWVPKEEKKLQKCFRNWTLIKCHLFLLNDFWSVSRLPGNAAQVLEATRFLLKILGKKNTTPQQIWVLEEQKKNKKKKREILLEKLKNITVLIPIMIMIIAAMYWVFSMGQASSQACCRRLTCACPTRALLELVGTGLGGWLLNIQEFSELSLNCS